VLTWLLLCVLLLLLLLPVPSLASQVCFELVGYLLEELRDGTNFTAFKQDLEDANVFIGSLIFIEELAEKVRGGCVRRGVGGDSCGGV
jgi:hypothetical protein